MPRKKIEETLELTTIYILYSDNATLEQIEDINNAAKAMFNRFVFIYSGKKAKLKCNSKAIWGQFYCKNKDAKRFTSKFILELYNDYISKYKTKLIYLPKFDRTSVILVHRVYKLIDNMYTFTTKDIHLHIKQNNLLIISTQDLNIALRYLNIMQIVVREKTDKRLIVYHRTDRSFYLDDKYLV